MACEPRSSLAQGVLGRFSALSAASSGALGMGSTIVTPLVAGVSGVAVRGLLPPSE
ncbi:MULTISPECIES: hypothetical protein [Haloarcula]|uniref:hypothetical protein n=1 Tax=Haloarcula TaxID=2237 RepID=UPI001E29D9B8|nr:MULTISPECIES: hypothetical protein [Halomicroarcula]MDS0277228.1 hypothetical protein [Halomicroarcula sp. S1AR25-4]